MRLVAVTGWQLLPTSQAQHEPQHRLALFGRQHDTRPPLCNVIIHSEQHGDVPGKGQEFSKAWYSYGGREYIERRMTNVKWLASTSDRPLTLRRNDGMSRPANAVPCGRQRDGVYYAAVARTAKGLIPGKAKDHKCCYCPYGGKEYPTVDFDWVVY